MIPKTNYENERLTVFLNGEIDHHSSIVLRYHIDQMILQSTPKEIELNFKDVSFMDSSGIGLIMGRFKLAKQYDAAVFISQASPYLKRVMRLAGLDKIISIDTEEKQ